MFMKNSLTLHDVNYISAKRAQEVFGYTSDYIGQLCRADKLECRMIGRSWFVTERSLIAHKSDSPLTFSIENKPLVNPRFAVLILIISLIFISNTVFSYRSDLESLISDSKSSLGMVITPSLGNSLTNDSLKQKIKENFSDDVEVIPDGDIDSGIIKPIFKNKIGDDFVYVLVPVSKNK
jgi:hypothetical protein